MQRRQIPTRPFLLDARLLAYRRGGIQRYIEQLAAALARIEPMLPLRVIQNRPVSGLPWPTTRVMTPPHHRWERLSLGLELTLRRPALVHSVDAIPPYLPPWIRSVVTVHDVAFLEQPSLLDAHSRHYYGQIFAALPRADRIITVSQTTAGRLANFFPQLQPRIRVVYLGVASPQRLAPPLAWQVIANRLGQQTVQRLQERPIVLSVGTVEPRKRYPLLCQAIDSIWQEMPANAPFLVILGQHGWQADEALAAIQEGIRCGWLFWINDADDQLRDALFSVATLLAIPSADEGFSLPAAEAMAIGLPVVAAARGALPEILDKAGILVTADEPEVWAKVLHDVLHDSTTRQRLGTVGQERCKRFLWDETARQTLAVYWEVVTQCRTHRRG